MQETKGYRRHFCLWAVLVLLAMVYAFMTVAGPLMHFIDSSQVDSPQVQVNISDELGISRTLQNLFFAPLFGLAHLVCIIALFRWKKWGLFGLVLMPVFLNVLCVIFWTLRITQSLPVPVFPIMTWVLLFVALSMGGDNKGWNKLE